MQSGYHVVTLHVKKSSHHKTIIAAMESASLMANVYLVKPAFDVWEPMPTLPDHQLDRQESIHRKWEVWNQAKRTLPMCLAFCLMPLPTGGSTTPLQDALLSDHGWECIHTEKEVKLVRRHKNTFVKNGFALFMRFPLDTDYVATVAENVLRAPQRYKRGIKVAPGRFSWDLSSTSRTVGLTQ
jgi:hypothetical protein